MNKGRFTSKPREKEQLDDSQRKEKIEYVLKKCLHDRQLTPTEMDNGYLTLTTMEEMEPITSLYAPILVKNGIEAIIHGHDQSRDDPKAIKMIVHYGAVDTVKTLFRGMVKADLETYQDILTEMGKFSGVVYEVTGSDQQADMMYYRIGLPTELNEGRDKFISDTPLKEYLRSEENKSIFQTNNSTPRWDIAIKFAKTFLDKYRNHPVTNLDRNKEIAKIRNALQKANL